MKRLLPCILALLLTLSASALAEDAVRVAVLKGPTGMGAAELMRRADNGGTDIPYDFTIAGAPDLLTAQLVTGELDMAALPTNAIALLHSKTGGAVQALAVNTLGVLYVLEKGTSVHGVDDLAGRTIVCAGRGSTAEAVADYLLGDSATVDYVSEHAEAAAQAVSGRYDLVLLPEPFVTSLLMQDAGFRIAVDLTAAWEASTGVPLPMGGIAVRRAFAEARPDAVAAFLAAYAQSVAFANENPADAAEIIAAYDIMAAPVAAQAIPRANMVCLTGAEMRAALEAFYGVLLEATPDLIGGALPDAGFYAAP